MEILKKSKSYHRWILVRSKRKDIWLEIWIPYDENIKMKNVFFHKNILYTVYDHDFIGVAVSNINTLNILAIASSEGYKMIKNKTKKGVTK